MPHALRFENPTGLLNLPTILDQKYQKITVPILQVFLDGQHHVGSELRSQAIAAAMNLMFGWFGLDGLQGLTSKSGSPWEPSWKHRRGLIPSVAQTGCEGCDELKTLMFLRWRSWSVPISEAKHLCENVDSHLQLFVWKKTSRQRPQCQKPQANS